MIGAISRSTRWRVSMARSSPGSVAGSNCTKSASCSSLRGYVPDCPLSTGCGHNDQIGRASCRERGCQYVEIVGVDVSLKKKKTKKMKEFKREVVKTSNSTN